uniref:Cystathionine gamma-lyase n=1 Tax=Cyanoderma ruficeps TaxID=181631 RepID=A0A8C3XCW9_9PASS
QGQDPSLGTPGFLPPFKHFATSAIHSGQEPEQWRSGAVVPPISVSTTFKQRAPGEHTVSHYVYTRFGNPSRHILEEVVGTLDGAQSLAYSSGLAALLNICHLLKTGDTVICMDDVYGGGYSTLWFQSPSFFGFVQLVWLETPTNPTLKVIDIQACADVVHRHPGVLLAVDNSLMSPYFQRPLSLGADICMSSATKYMNGHSDVLMGVISVNDEDLYNQLKFLQSALGAVPSPFDCYMCNRGLKTLHIRMKLHFHNGLAVAKFLKSHRRVEKVIYPGLHCHPQYEVTKKQNSGVSGVMSFYIKGNIKNALAFLNNLKVFALAESLGGYESLAEHPATMTHKSVPEDVREDLGITETLIRLSVGLEDEEDLLADLDQALEAAVSGVPGHPGNGIPVLPAQLRVCAAAAAAAGLGHKGWFLVLLSGLSFSSHPSPQLKILIEPTLF